MVVIHEPICVLIVLDAVSVHVTEFTPDATAVCGQQFTTTLTVIVCTQTKQRRVQCKAQQAVAGIKHNVVL